MQRFFALAGKKTADSYKVLSSKQSIDAFPIENALEEPFMRTNVLLKLIEEWKGQQDQPVIPIVCVSTPLLHTFRDGSQGNVCGVCSRNNACIVTTHNYSSSCGSKKALIELSLTVIHELGHDFHLSPDGRMNTNTHEKYGTHCADRSCAMYEHYTQEQNLRWQRGTPFCDMCMTDLNIPVLPPEVVSLADVE